MVLHEEYNDDLTNEEIKRIITNYLSHRLNIDFDKLAEEIINSCEKHDETNDIEKNNKKYTSDRFKYDSNRYGKFIIDNKFDKTYKFLSIHDRDLFELCRILNNL